MTARVGVDDLVLMLEGAVKKVQCEHIILSRLDAATGDGDHGTTMLRAANRIANVIADRKAENVGSLFKSVAFVFLSLDGGATGPLFGTWFMGMSEAAGAKQELHREDFPEVFEAGLNALRKQTKAQPGDKTLLDALVPAVAALRSEANAGKTIVEMLSAAATAATIGARSTRDLVARFGRSKNLGERTLGTEDPGATTVALLFQGFHSGFVEVTGT